jgi:hypothetical protein
MLGHFFKLTKAAKRCFVRVLGSDVNATRLRIAVSAPWTTLSTGMKYESEMDSMWPSLKITVTVYCIHTPDTD